MQIILKKPIVSEKLSKQNEQGVYGFVVDKKANKLQIKAAVERMYNVNVVSVRTANILGKKIVRMTKTRIMPGNKPNFKKAYVQLAEGQIIDFYSEVQ